MKLSVIVPVFNAFSSIEKLVNSLINQKVNFDYEIILVDDFSSDGTIDKLRTINQKKFKNLKIYFNEKNFGNGYTKNFGFKKSSGEIILFLDDHCSINDQFLLKKYVDTYLISDNIAGVCGFYKTSNPELDKNYYRDLRREYIYGKKEGEKFFISKDNRTTFSIVIGGFRRKVIESFGFPEDFFNYASEDTYLQILLESKGYTLYYNGNLKCYHTHNLNIIQIVKKIVIEANGTITLFRKLFRVNMSIPYLKFFLETKLINFIFIFFLLLLNFYLGILIFLIYFMNRYFIYCFLRLKRDRNYILGLILYVFVYDILKLGYLLYVIISNRDTTFLKKILNHELQFYLNFLTNPPKKI